MIANLSSFVFATFLRTVPHPIPYHKSKSHSEKIHAPIDDVVHSGFRYSRFRWNRISASHVLQGCVAGLTKKLPDMPPSRRNRSGVVLELRKHAAVGQVDQDGGADQEDAALVRRSRITASFRTTGRWPNPTSTRWSPGWTRALRRAIRRTRPSRWTGWKAGASVSRTW